MRKVGIYIFIYFSILFSTANAQVIRIGLMDDYLSEAFSFHCLEGSFELLGEGEELLTIEKGDMIFLRIQDGKILLNDGKNFSARFDDVKFSDSGLKSQFSIKMVKPMLETRYYEGEFEVSIKHDVFQLINILDFDRYLAGVVETEAGPGAPDEFFRVQAVLCRTYAVSNWNKHTLEGFDLCDNTHCQAFHGRNNENPDILEAVYSTHGIVIADKSYKLIDAVYHSNSGGQTQKSEGFWPEKKDYLLSILDPFSENQRNSVWEYTMDWELWKNYFVEMGVDLEEVDSLDLLIKQNYRKTFIEFDEDTIYLKNIRSDFGLKSAYFNVNLEGDKVLLKGKGYGHGLGLSQEGAMEMVRQGYSYKDVINYYYNDVMIRDLKDLPFNSIPEIFR